MSFWGHLDILRGVLFRIIAITAIFAIALFIAMHWIFDYVILAPCHNDFPLYKLFNLITQYTLGESESTPSTFHVDLINIKLASQFFIHISTSCWLAITLAFPFIIYQLWGFVSPGLYDHEKRGIKTDNGFDIKADLTDFEDPMKYSVRQNPDGSIDIVIKNVRFYEEK